MPAYSLRSRHNSQIAFRLRGGWQLTARLFEFLSQMVGVEDEPRSSLPVSTGSG